MNLMASFSPSEANSDLATILNLLQQSERAVVVYDDREKVVWKTTSAGRVAHLLRICGPERWINVRAAANRKRQPYERLHEFGEAGPWDYLVKYREHTLAARLIWRVDVHERLLRTEWVDFELPGSRWSACFMFGWESLDPQALDRLRLGFGLTVRERDLCLMLHDGQSVEDIGAIFGKSASTIRAYMRDIHSKVGADSFPSLLAEIRKVLEG